MKTFERFRDLKKKMEERHTKDLGFHTALHDDDVVRELLDLAQEVWQ